MYVPLTSEELVALEALEKAATTGPWELADCGLASDPIPSIIHREPDGDWVSICSTSHGADAFREAAEGSPDRALIAALRNAAPRLLEELRTKRMLEQEAKS